MTVPWHFYSNTSHISIIIVYLITTWEQDHKTTQAMIGATMHHHWFRDGHLLFADWWLCCWHFSHCKSLPCMTSYSRLVLHLDLRSKTWKCYEKVDIVFSYRIMWDEVTKVDFSTAIFFWFAVRTCPVNDLLARFLQVAVHGETTIILVI